MKESKCKGDATTKVWDIKSKLCYSGVEGPIPFLAGNLANSVYKAELTQDKDMVG